MVCPYGRLQSALIDADTVVIGYDRGAASRAAKAGAGDAGTASTAGAACVVCPTGIDIRNGLQMECVGCANCIDACDEVMDRLGRPRGLVRYDSQRGLDGQPRRWLRPRLVIYVVLGLVGAAVFAASVAGRSPFEVRVLRTRDLPYTLDGGVIRNLYNVRVENKRPEARTFTLRVEAPQVGAFAPAVVVARPELTLEGLTDDTVPVFVTVPRESYREPFALRLEVVDAGSGSAVEAELRFLGP